MSESQITEKETSKPFPYELETNQDSSRIMNGSVAAFIIRFQLLWLVLICALCLFFANDIAVLKQFPKQWQLPFESIFNALMDGFISFSGSAFKGLAMILSYPMNWVRELLQWLPWCVLMLMSALVSYRAGGFKLVVFSIVSLFYMLFTGLWEASMNSLALVLISVPLAVLLGFALGVLGFFSKRSQRVILPLLDIAQTIPAFAYLLPILLLFGFGPVVGLIASILFAFAPMVRNTLVGLQQVDPQVIESGLMSGANASQLFFLVRFPSALKQILLGVNQTTMASLSMVIIASIIGGTADIGWQVLSTMRKAQFGESLVAGLVIVLLAMMLDRITAGLAQRKSLSVSIPSNSLSNNSLTGFFLNRRFVKVLQQRFLGRSLVFFGALLLVLGIASVLEFLWVWPSAWHIDFASVLNSAITDFISQFRGLLTSIKNNSLFFVMLPLKIGLDQAISPFTWGFSATLWHWVIYAASSLIIAGFFIYKKCFNLAATVIVLAMVFYSGLVNFPWLAFCLVAVFIAWHLGGIRLALATSFGLGFLLLSGSWQKAMLSVYLCTVAIFIAFFWGTLLGIIAASNNRFSRFMRPINDALQTMPPFVMLIPFVMLFKIGEFTAMLAIIFYAYVPAFRYCEFGLRKVPQEIIEAATSMGTTKMQLLFQVKLPLALPNIMLGLNQSIMYGISMLVITALVGTNGLGQQVYIGLSKGDFGIGIVAGIGMAIIAMLADRFCQAWQRKYAANAV